MKDDRLEAVRDHVKMMHLWAWDDLRNSSSLSPALVDSRGLRFGRPKLLLWRDAEGFVDYEPYTLTVLESFGGSSATVRRAEWHRRRDFRGIQEFDEGKRNELPPPLPTVTVADATIDSARFNVFLEEVYHLRIPITWPWLQTRDSLTTDVPMVGFEFYDQPQPQASVRFAWAHDVPPGWEPIAAWFWRMLAWLEAQFDVA